MNKESAAEKMHHGEIHIITEKEPTPFVQHVIMNVLKKGIAELMDSTLQLLSGDGSIWGSDFEINLYLLVESEEKKNGEC